MENRALNEILQNKILDYASLYSNTAERAQLGLILGNTCQLIIRTTGTQVPPSLNFVLMKGPHSKQNSLLTLSPWEGGLLNPWIATSITLFTIMIAVDSYITRANEKHHKLHDQWPLTTLIPISFDSLVLTNNSACLQDLHIFLQSKYNTKQKNTFLLTI